MDTNTIFDNNNEFSINKTFIKTDKCYDKTRRWDQIYKVVNLRFQSLEIRIRVSSFPFHFILKLQCDQTKKDNE